jgi:hypothetical protein
MKSGIVGHARAFTIRRDDVRGPSVFCLSAHPGDAQPSQEAPANVKMKGSIRHHQVISFSFTIE